jgi:predicted transcriptional regulator
LAKLSTKQLDNFRKAASSLKLFSRAELADEKNRSLIERLYVDPLPNEQIFKTLMGDSTTILIGRKGTGKSTVFQRAQHEIRKNKSNVISAYMDIRNTYEASQIDQQTLSRLENIAEALSQEQVKKLLLYKRFFQILISDIRTEIKNQVESNFLTRIRDRILGTSAEVFSGLDKLVDQLEQPSYDDVGGTQLVKSKVKGQRKVLQKGSASADAATSLDKPSASVSVKLSAEHESVNERGNEDEYSQILMRYVGVNQIIEELRGILNAIGVRYLYIFLDDFSELPREAMELLVDVLINPLTRWSDFVKFKIAAYPGRVYLGSLDKTKIEEVYLDMYGLYGTGGVNKMEEKATDFVHRLVERRISHFTRSELDSYFDMKGDVWRTLFYASMGNPRTIGHIILYGYESNLIYGRRIGVRAIQEAAQRYYEEKVASFFSTAKYRMSFHERSSVYSLRELLEQIVSRARNLRQEDRHSKQPRRSYSSHFYVAAQYEDILSSLELNFFLTKYFEQSDREGQRVAVFALNYGLCSKYQISFGRPLEQREDRLFFVERRFDNNPLIAAYMRSNQEIKCGSCSAEFPPEMLPALKMLHMKCPTCRDGTCKIVNVSKKYEALIESVIPELLLPDTELAILETLHIESKEMVASEIAGELDCSGQLVGRRARNLADRDLVTREQAGPVYRYEITDKARSAYFGDPDATELDLGA